MSSYQVLFVMCPVLLIWWLQTLKSCSLHKFFTKNNKSTKCFLLVVPLDHREKIKLSEFFPDVSLIKRVKGIFSYSNATLRKMTICVIMTFDFWQWPLQCKEDFCLAYEERRKKEKDIYQGRSR